MTAIARGAVASPRAPGMTRSDLVTERLRDEVLRGVFAPGNRLRQVEIAARYGVSTTPVREAFATLAQEGIVLRDSNRGVVVFAPSAGEVAEIYEIRMVLEPLATELACKRISEIDLDELDAIIDEMQASRDRALRDQLNRRFHARIYSHADRVKLGSLIDQLRDAASVYLRFLSSHSVDPGYRAEADLEHRAIVQALRRRDASAAADAVRLHLAHSQRHIEDAITAPPERG